MDYSQFDGDSAGAFEPTADGALAFVPHDLPVEVELPPALLVLFDRAARAVATLDGVGETLENPLLLIRPFMRREAALSSRIEGTQASVADVYEYEASGRSRSPDAIEVANYVAALELGRERLADLPICVRLAHEVHNRLMSGARGHERKPGAFRDRTVWIGADGTPVGEARFVPAPHTRVPELMSSWEKWVNGDLEIPPLIRAALLHYQFETIHPYLDGNGRLGRLFIVLYLISSGVLSTPLLYLSAYFERHRTEYYDHLLAVSRTGNWLPWIEFFLRGAEEQANDAVARSRRLRDLHRDYRRRLEQVNASGNLSRLTEMLFQTPVVTRPMVQDSLGVSTRGAALLVDRLVEASILIEIPDTRPTVFVAREILSVIQDR